MPFLLVLQLSRRRRRGAFLLNAPRDPGVASEAPQRNIELLVGLDGARSAVTMS
jgi:hypothetical protein